ncbi:MAG: bacteriohemerythrin [Bacteroidales bacterium]
MKNWNDKYLLNISIIDNQHRGFFTLLDEELSRIENPTQKQMIELLDKLENYLWNHFSEEERLLEKSGYKDLALHKQQHLYFIQKVNEMKLELSYKNQLLYNNLIDFMKKWFLAHILHLDKKYQEIVLDYIQKTNG